MRDIKTSLQSLIQLTYIKQIFMFVWKRLEWRKIGSISTSTKFGTTQQHERNVNIKCPWPVWLYMFTDTIKRFFFNSSIDRWIFWPLCKRKAFEFTPTLKKLPSPLLSCHRADNQWWGQQRLGTSCMTLQSVINLTWHFPLWLLWMISLEKGPRVTFTHFFPDSIQHPSIH